MSRYWVYIDDRVSGPYNVDQLIRIRGFSRQTRVCLEDGNDSPQSWTSPADIPELSRIFKAVDDVQAIVPPVARPFPKPAHPKPRPRHVPSHSSEPTPVAPRAPSRIGLWLGLVAVALASGSAFWMWQKVNENALLQERQAAQRLVEDVDLPAGSAQATFGQYLVQKNIKPRWEFTRQSSGLQHVTASWFETAAPGSPTSTVYAFEVNLQAQSVRPLNSRASTLLTEGIGRSKPAATAPVKPKVPSFTSAINEWKQAQESGDFESVWNSFSARKIREMRKGGITRDGFMRLQALTHKLETGMTVSIEKTQSESDETKLVLIRQVQPKRPDVYIKQYWVLEEETWKLDDEQKKALEAAPAPASAPLPVTALPGVSN